MSADKFILDLESKIRELNKRVAVGTLPERRTAQKERSKLEALIRKANEDGKSV